MVNHYQPLLTIIHHYSPLSIYASYQTHPARGLLQKDSTEDRRNWIRLIEGNGCPQGGPIPCDAMVKNMARWPVKPTWGKIIAGKYGTFMWIIVEKMRFHEKNHRNMWISWTKLTKRVDFIGKNGAKKMISSWKMRISLAKRVNRCWLKKGRSNFKGFYRTDWELNQNCMDLTKKWKIIEA